jgi:hypothetical protein
MPGFVDCRFISSVVHENAPFEENGFRVSYKLSDLGEIIDIGFLHFALAPPRGVTLRCKIPSPAY